MCQYFEGKFGHERIYLGKFRHSLYVAFDKLNYDLLLPFFIK